MIKLFVEFFGLFLGSLTLFLSIASKYIFANPLRLMIFVGVILFLSSLFFDNNRGGDI